MSSSNEHVDTMHCSTRNDGFMFSISAREPRAEGYEGLGAPDFDELLVAAFERVAKAVPLRSAFGSEGWQTTYKELNETANRLAHRLAAYSEFEVALRS